MTENPFIPGKKIPLNILLVMDTDDRGLYYWEDQPVFDNEEAERLWGKYGERVEDKTENKTDV